MPHDPRALPEFTSWPTFPFEGDLRVKVLEEPAEVEPPRQGEDPATCSACQAPDVAYIWVSDRWRVRALDRPSGLPMVLILESRSHLDLGDLPNLLAAELGVMTVRLERAMRSIDGVGRVHINRWGDGSAHLHLWFLARPYGRLQLRGTFLSLWDDILPPITEVQWRENLALVPAWLAEFGGRPLAAPPPIDWKAPTRFDPRAAQTVEGPGADGIGAGEADEHGGLEGPPQADGDGGPQASDAGPGGAEPDGYENDGEESGGDGRENRETAEPTDSVATEVAAEKGTEVAAEVGTEATDEAVVRVRPRGSDESEASRATSGTEQAGGAKADQEAGARPTRRKGTPAAKGKVRQRVLAPDPADPEDAWEDGV